MASPIKTTRVEFLPEGTYFKYVNYGQIYSINHYVQDRNTCPFCG